MIIGNKRRHGDNDDAERQNFSKVTASSSFRSKEKLNKKLIETYPIWGTGCSRCTVYTSNPKDKRIK